MISQWMDEVKRVLAARLLFPCEQQLPAATRVAAVDGGSYRAGKCRRRGGRTASESELWFDRTSPSSLFSLQSQDWFRRGGQTSRILNAFLLFNI